MHICRHTSQCEPLLLCGARLSQASGDSAAVENGIWSDTHTLRCLKAKKVLDVCLDMGTGTGQAAWWKNGLKDDSCHCSFSVSTSVPLSLSLSPHSSLFLTLSLYISLSLPLLASFLPVWCSDDMMIVFSMLVDSWQKEVGSGGRACLLFLIICEATSVYQHGTQTGLRGPREGGRITCSGGVR